MRALIAIAVLAGCEQGSMPDGVVAPLQGSWRNGMWTMAFDEDAHTFAWSDSLNTRTGTWMLNGNYIEMACDQCIWEGTTEIRVDADYMLLDGVVMSGSETVQAGASWTGQATAPDASCASRFRFATNIVKLTSSAVEEHSGGCCLGASNCGTVLLNTGRWEANADGFTMNTGLSKQFYLLLGAISVRRWTREVSASR